MPAIIPFLPAIIGAAGSIGGAVLGNKGKNTSTTTPQRDSLQSGIQGQLAEILKSVLGAGPNVPAWMKAGSAKTINEGYASALPRMESQLASRGFDTSGKEGATVRNLEVGRVNALSSANQQNQGFADQRFQDMLKLAFQFQQPQGQTTTGTQSQNPLGSVVSGVGSDLSSFLNLRNLFSQFGGGGNDYGGDGSVGIH